MVGLGETPTAAAELGLLVTKDFLSLPRSLLLSRRKEET